MKKLSFKISKTNLKRFLHRPPSACRPQLQRRRKACRPRVAFSFSGGAWRCRNTILKTTFFGILFTAFLVIGIPTQTLALDYSTLKNGNWNNTTDVWSTDGSTACGCNPGSVPNNQTVAVDHNIIMTNDVTLNGNSTLTVNSGADIDGGSTYDLTLQNTSGLTNHGTITVYNLSLQNNTSLYNDGFIYVNGDLILNNTGSVTNDNGIDVTGNIDLNNNTSVGGTGGFDVGGNITIAAGSSWVNTDWCAGGSSDVTGLSECCTCVAAILPISLIYFNAIPQENVVVVSWITVSEINNDYFTVERAADGISFEPIVIVNGAGNSNIELHYKITDDSPLYGISYYRLKQTDYDGHYEYFPMRSVKYEGNRNEIKFNAYPNPFDGENIHLSIPAVDGEEVLVVLCNSTGKTVYSKVIIPENSLIPIAIDPSNKLASGIYLMIVSSKSGIVKQKLVVH